MSGVDQQKVGLNFLFCYTNSLIELYKHIINKAIVCLYSCAYVFFSGSCALCIRAHTPQDVPAHSGNRKKERQQTERRKENNRQTTISSKSVYFVSPFK